MCEQCTELNERQAKEAKKPEVMIKESRGRGLSVVVNLPEMAAPVSEGKQKSE